MRRILLRSLLAAAPVCGNPETTVNLPGGATMGFVWIEPGMFTMGTAEAQEQLLRDSDLWYDYNENEQPTHEVAISRGFWLANPWGLHDMHGNVWEVCLDNPCRAYAAAPQRDPLRLPPGPGVMVVSPCVFRGGSFNNRAINTRSAWRMNLSADRRYIDLGARLVRTGPTPTSVTPEGWGEVKAQVQP